MINITITGHLGNSPTLKQLDNGQTVCNFSVGVNDDYTDNNGNKISRTAWFQVQVWLENLAKACHQHLSKGRQVLVQGTLVYDKTTGAPRIFKNKQTGYAQTSFELKANFVEFLGKSTQNSAPAENIPVAPDDTPH